MAALLFAFRGLHIAAAAVALTAMWIPILTKKGGATHRRAGWTYASAMWIAAMTAWVICAIRLLDADRANDAAAIFLAFVGLLATNGAVVGIRILRTRSRTDRHRGLLDVAFSALFFVASVALFAFGALERSALFISFAGLGLFLSVGQLRFWLKPPVSKLAWWYEHMGNMLTACIGTVTAFLVVNVPRLGLERYALVFWLAPGVLGGIGIALWQRRYRMKLEPNRGS